MKSLLVIGMSRFGKQLCNYLAEQGNDVLVIDKDEEKVSDLIYSSINVQIGDCTDPSVVKSLGVSDFDIVFVCIGSNFQDSLETTSLVKEMGAAYVISKANTEVHAKLLRRVGADEVIDPDKDMAERAARRYSMDHVYDYIELQDDCSMAEVIPMKEWIGKNVAEINVRGRYQVTIISINNNVMISPKYIFKADDHMLIVGRNEDVEKFVRKY